MEEVFLGVLFIGVVTIVNLIKIHKKAVEKREAQLQRRGDALPSSAFSPSRVGGDHPAVDAGHLGACPTEDPFKGQMNAPLHRHSLENAPRADTVSDWQELPGNESAMPGVLGMPLTEEKLREAVILSEVLGAPRSRRRASK